MIHKKVLQDWLAAIPDGHEGVFIDEGGLTLCSTNGAYLEVGGDPSEDDLSTKVERNTCPPAPLEVLTVARAMATNAEEAGFGEKRAFCHYVDNEGPVPEWRISDNWDRSPTALIYREGKWFSRQCFDGNDVPMHGGYNEALDTAEIFFTG
jgi:hypothetical protein